MGSYRGQEVIRGALREGIGPGDPVLRHLLDEWDGEWYLDWADADGGSADLVLVGRPGPDRVRWALHLALLALTLFTTHLAGALLHGIDPLHARPVDAGGLLLPLPTGLRLDELALGAPFALTLMGILLAHEMGHYTAARFHRVRATLPFFIPFPAYYSVVGTLGAFIRIKGPTVRRSVLFDIGAAGPCAGFVLSVPVLLWGLHGSSQVHLPPGLDPSTPFVVHFAGQTIGLGSSLLTGWLASVVGTSLEPGGALLLHPVAFAGWLGLFVTSLNLLPLGQLDGGHILYTLTPARQPLAAAVFLAGLVGLGYSWWGWWFWAAAALVVSRRRIVHPPVLQERVAVGPARLALGLLAVVMFFITFVIVPVRL